MSVGEIMQQLPSLSLAERRILTNRLLELEPDRAAIEMCDHLADEAMQVLDRMEEEDARHSKG